MSQIIPIFIPTYINSAEYTPARVLPRLLFYNGLLDCEQYWIESGSAAFGGVTFAQNAFPYFDNYNVVSGQFPTSGSNSLLFTNETAVYGSTPNNSLYTTYWDTYISLLYNPKTRLVNCSAIIPLADYFKMELNDIVNFRGNYYHLRAINDYSLKTGECNLQLLGPIINTSFEQVVPTENCSFAFTSSLITTTTTTIAPTTTTTVAPTTTTTTVGESCISASLTGATTGTFTSGGFNWNYIELFSPSGTELSQTLQITSGFTTQAKLLLVAGGGGGAYSTSGGSYGNGGAGGAGQVLYVDSLTLSSGSYNIVVGSGGAGGSFSARTQGSNGNPSTALGYTANGGGGGGGASPTNAGRSVTGGSGGGGGANGAGGTGTFSGGSNASTLGGGGGGGATANGTAGASGIGGTGFEFNIYGVPFDVGGGGNGGNSSVSGGNVGVNGGGRGSRSGQSAQGGVNGSGGGAGGGATVGSATAPGGSGRFLLFWKSCTQPTTTTTTAAPTTTTTTISGSTTTTIAPGTLPAGAAIIYDFGNVSSYPGSGSTVFDLSGNNVTGSLVNNPTFSTANGGILTFVQANSQRIDFRPTITPNTTVLTLWKNTNATFNVDTGFPSARFNNGIVWAALNSSKDFTPVLLSNSGSGNTFFNADATPADITTFHQYACSVESSGDFTTAIAYLDGTGSITSETKFFDRRSVPTSGSAYLAWDSAVIDRYANGSLMGYLQYNRTLTAAEIQQIYSVFRGRF